MESKPKLTVVAGKASADHRRKMVLDLSQNYQTDPADYQYFYIVPNHVKFSAEVDVLDQLRAQLQQPETAAFAQSRVQVFSFSRLAWYYMQRTDYYRKQRLDNTGLSMLVYRILQRHNSELKLYKDQAEKPGFVNQLVLELQNLITGRIAPEDLGKLAANLENGPTAKTDQAIQNTIKKLRDLQILLSAYQRAMRSTTDQNGQVKEGFIQQADVLDELTQYLTDELKQVDLSHTRFYVEGFDHFTAQEFHLLSTLIKQAASVQVSLILAPQPQNAINDVFAEARHTYQMLANLGAEPTVETIAAQTGFRRVTPDLQQLEDYWISRSSGVTRHEQQQTKPLQDVHVANADNRYTELVAVATKIHQMVMAPAADGHEPYHYNDFIVASPKLADYQTLLAAVFEQAEIPYFNDLQTEMADHPLIAFIDALFAVPAHHYQYEDVMRLLRTELLLPKDPASPTGYMDRHVFRHNLDLAENYMLQWGKQGSDFTDAAKPWKQRPDEDENAAGEDSRKHDMIPYADWPEAPKEVEAMHQFIATTLPPLYADLNRSRTGATLLKKFYRFIKSSGVSAQLQQWQQDALAKDQLQTASQQQQVWQTFTTILDEYHLILGDEKLTKGSDKLGNFANTLKAGFAGAKFSQIPSTLDQVQVTRTNLRQTQSRKVVFVIGATADDMPARITDDAALLDDFDLDQIEQINQHPTLKDAEFLAESADSSNNPTVLSAEQFLNETTQKQMGNETNVNYHIFMTGREQLYLSYPLLNAAGETLKVSPYVRSIAAYFSLAPRHFQTVPSQNNEPALAYVGTQRTTLTQLVNILHGKLAAPVQNDPAAASDQEQPQDEKEKQLKKQREQKWLYIYTLLKKDTKQADPKLTKRVISSLDYANAPENLSANVREQLYPHDLVTSISQLESYYQDPYEYFLKYGLHLQTRKTNELNPMKMGNYFHLALRMYMDQLKDLKQADPDLKEERAKEVMEDVLAALQNDPDYALLQASNQMQYRRSQLDNVLRQMAIDLFHQGQELKSHVWRTEVPFGMKGSQFAGLSLPVLDGNDQLVPDRHVKVRGQIDRIDSLSVNSLTGEDLLYLLVFDYKSRDRDFDYTQAYYGLQLQLLTYLNAIDRNPDFFTAPDNFGPGKQIIPAGAFYQHVQNPALEMNNKRLLNLAQNLLSDAPDVRKDALKKLLEQRMAKQTKNQGIILDNTVQDNENHDFNPDSLLAYLDQNIAEDGHLKQGKSSVLPLQYKAKNGGFADSSLRSLVDEKQMQLLLAYNRYLIQKAAGKILSGEIELAPARIDDTTTFLEHSDFLPILQFDPLAGDQYNDITTLHAKNGQNKKEVALEKMQEKLPKEGYDDKN
ncbi:ATP-dependent helicase deoxyribonuclease subunit B [Lactobacillus selangorensis]|uniref:ATP-dependent helicase deoxyribonuclease subunit B n=1 Tax=Lactobacillus selangorensis TaxID=81857 RepID=A0A0R2G7J1_9LACO|nr:PD-(D/E)XK nuclease family protein [Lactobacillus selangorensis]KRN28953.1 ATP-dependent helicase deoxyribonuclease subunit B [Lactobacillus selangorensis]KRN32637.1 ATP-dependent helicase deoxyribonuclease subunit B [Lactobacillus selangorensis]